MWIVSRLTTACLVFSFFLAAQEVRITHGAADDQVFQRNTEGFANIQLSGSATGRKTNGKPVEVRVTSKAGPVAGLDWTPIAKAQKGVWSGEIQRIPTGGPYKIEVRLEGTPGVNPVNQIFVGDLWLLAGQSNMEGVGDLIDVQPPSEMVHSFDLADNWVVAREPLHTLVSAADAVHWPLNAEHQPERFTGEKLERYLAERKKGAGLGLPFAVEMAKRTGIPIGLVPCAHGGTSMDQWDPALKDQGGDSLYGSMLRRFHAVGGHVKGVLWYQGESDANPKAAPAFETKFIAFIKAVRADFTEPGLPFYYVQIGRFVNGQNEREWNAVQQAQLDALSRIPGTAPLGMVSSVDLSLDDPIHVSTQEHKRLARRLANLACHDLFPASANCGQLKSGPRPVSAVLDRNVIKVVFSGVNGRLMSDGRISGFSIHDASGLPVPLIFKAVIDPAEASTVGLYMQGKLPEHAVLHYGFGKDPYCNLRDAEDMAVPVFGPMPIGQKQ
jgi:sialate O-acetylesterase